MTWHHDVTDSKNIDFIDIETTETDAKGEIKSVDCKGKTMSTEAGSKIMVGKTN